MSIVLATCALLLAVAAPAAATGQEESPPTATIGGRVWWDVDTDGIQDDDEPGVPDVTVVGWTDDDGDGVPDARMTTTTTGADGTYVLGLSLAAPAYLVEFVTDDPFTVPDAGTDDWLDSDADPGTGLTGPIPGTTGPSAPTVDAGVVRPVVVEDPPAALTGRVWDDDDRDGLRDDGEPGVVDVTVTLWTDDDGDGGPDTEVDSTTTDADGRYRFDGLSPGGAFLVQFAEPIGSRFTTPDVGGDDAIDSDADPATGTAVVPALDFAAVGVIDAGLVMPGMPTHVDPPPSPVPVALIAGRAWLDEDGDGIQDDGEPGLADINVDLSTYDETHGRPDTRIASTTTGAEGRYLFEQLDSSLKYVVQFDSGRPITVQDAGTDDTLDSDADPFSGLTDPIGLVEPRVVDPTAIDVGFVILDPAYAWAIGRVWEDEDEDGIQDEGEPGVPDVTVEVWTDGDGDGEPDTRLTSTTTDAEGSYVTSFEYGLAGGFYVRFVEPAGFTLTTPDVGDDDTIDSDADPDTGFTAPNWSNMDAGLVRVSAAVPVTTLPEMGAGVGSALAIGVATLAIGVALLSGDRRRRDGAHAA